SHAAALRLRPRLPIGALTDGATIEPAGAAHWRCHTSREPDTVEVVVQARMRRGGLHLLGGGGEKRNLRFTCTGEQNSVTHKPTVSLGVTSAMTSSCGHDSGQIEPRIAQ